jgi:hypothetical protein
MKTPEINRIEYLKNIQLTIKQTKAETKYKAEKIRIISTVLLNSAIDSKTSGLEFVIPL